MHHAQLHDRLRPDRATYEGFAKFGPAMTGAYADTLNAMPKLVASRSLRGPLSWNASLVEGDVVNVVEQRKRDAGDIVVYGGGELIGTLSEAGLVDAFKIWVFPLVLGAGERLFRNPGAMELTQSTTLSSGVAILSSQPVTAGVQGG